MGRFLLAGERAALVVSAQAREAQKRAVAQAEEYSALVLQAESQCAHAISPLLVMVLG